ncbi:MAG: hypothetical protein HYX76_06875 [Acidobacteria bacterium]|nr:hypothetical protein [Acidobacteriota bacterium]
MINPSQRAALVITLAAMCAGAHRTIRAQDETRKIWDDGFRAKRPAGATPATGETSYRPATPPVRTAPSTADAVIGVTVLRLRPATNADDSAVRLLVQEEEKAGAQEWTPVRVTSDTPLQEGDRVRLSIEVPRAGFLYVIDREQYAAGVTGEPYLIFPTLRTNAGKHDVRAGRLIEIPAWTDKPPYFRLRRSRPDQTAELLTILVTPRPLADVRIGRAALKLTAGQVASWEKRWGAPAQRLEHVGGAGRTYTRSEREAATNRPRLLRREDPMPQTIYRVASRPGDPLVVSVPLAIR